VTVVSNQKACPLREVGRAEQVTHLKQLVQLLPDLKEALDRNTVTVIDCPVDYRENLKLTESLGQLTQQTER
jgi:thiamine pyrophosphate-dependent acetolactate synthase large subunit-like protein